MRNGPLYYNGRAGIADFLRTLGDKGGEQRETVAPPTRLKHMSRPKSDAAAATRISVRNMLEAQGREDGVIAGHFTLEVELPSPERPH